MGVGPGFAIAAQVANPGKRVIALEGDAAFGFDGMEVEVAVRHKLPITAPRRSQRTHRYPQAPLSPMRAMIK